MGRLTVLAVAVSLLASCAGDDGPDVGGGSQADAPTDALPTTAATTDVPSATTTDGPAVSAPPGGELPPAPSVVSPADDGAVFALGAGDVVDLVVPGPAVPDLEVEGTSVEVVDTMNVDDSGQRQWELRAVADGTTVIRGGGAFPFTVTLSVPS